MVANVRESALLMSDCCLATYVALMQPLRVALIWGKKYWFPQVNWIRIKARQDLSDML